MKWIISLLLLSQLTAFSHFESKDTSPVPDMPSNYSIYINLWDRTLKLMDQGEVIYTYPLGVGTKETPSPMGIFEITDKRKNWYDGFGPRWMELSVPWGTFGIHGTSRPHSIGGYVSNGCFRMFDRDVVQLYDFIPIGTKVIIDGPLSGHKDITYRVLVNGSRGSLVQIVQNRLQAAGYYTGLSDGIFDTATEKALIQYQEDHGLEPTAQVHYVDLLQMGIIE